MRWNRKGPLGAGIDRWWGVERGTEKQTKVSPEWREKSKGWLAWRIGLQTLEKIIRRMARGCYREPLYLMVYGHLEQHVELHVKDTPMRETGNVSSLTLIELWNDLTKQSSPGLDIQPKIPQKKVDDKLAWDSNPLPALPLPPGIGQEWLSTRQTEMIHWSGLNVCLRSVSEQTTSSEI